SRHEIPNRVGHQPLVACCRRGVYELRAGNALCMERVRGAPRNAIWMEARRHVAGVYGCGDRVCLDVCGCRANPGSIRTSLLFTCRRHSRKPGLLSLLLHLELDLPDRLLWSHRRIRQWLWLCDADSGDGQMVS